MSTKKRTFEQALIADENASPRERMTRKRLDFDSQIDLNMELTLVNMSTSLFSRTEILIHFLQQLGLLAKSKICPEHNVPMKLVEDSKKCDGWKWYCNFQNCRKEKSIRDNSFFSESNLSLKQILIVSYSWFNSFPQSLAIKEATIKAFLEQVAVVFNPESNEPSFKYSKTQNLPVYDDESDTEDCGLEEQEIQIVNVQGTEINFDNMSDGEYDELGMDSEEEEDNENEDPNWTPLF